MSDSSTSDLSSLEEEYEPGPPSTSKKGVNTTAASSNYKIRNALKAPRATTYTAQSLYDQIHSSDIDLEPEYQRDVVWTEAKQIGLIDSVFRNFYIPPVIFAVKVLDDGSELRTCIDGKQRLTSIHRFMDGLIPHKDQSTNEKLWYRDVGTGSRKGRKKKLLPERYKKVFANKQIVCVEYQDITDDDEREIFARVQLGMALTPAEKLQAINSPKARFIKKLLEQYVHEGGLLSHSLDWDRNRASDFRFLANSIHVIEDYPGRIASASLNDPVWLAEDKGFPQAFQDKIHVTLQTFVKLVQDNKLNQVFQKPKKRVAPVEMVCIVLFIYVHREQYSLAQLAEGIGSMRTEVRGLEKDIRMNDRVLRLMIPFVRDYKFGDPQNGTSKTPVASEKKRKRGEEGSEEGEETSNGKIQRAAKKTAKPSNQASAGGVQAPVSILRTSKRDGILDTPTQSSAPATDRLAAIRAAKSTPRPLSRSASAANSSTPSGILQNEPMYERQRPASQASYNLPTPVSLSAPVNSQSDPRRRGHDSAGGDLSDAVWSSRR